MENNDKNLFSKSLSWEWFSIHSFLFQKIIDGFLENETSVEDFISEFIEKRTLAHTRRIKAEKVADMIRSKRTNSAHASVSSPSSGPLPYPVNYVMPMPGF